MISDLRRALHGATRRRGKVSPARTQFRGEQLIRAKSAPPPN